MFQIVPIASETDYRLCGLSCVRPDRCRYIDHRCWQEGSLLADRARCFGPVFAITAFSVFPHGHSVIFEDLMAQVDFPLEGGDAYRGSLLWKNRHELDSSLEKYKSH
jgi:hypothetical protein